MSKFYNKKRVFNLNDIFYEEVLDHELEDRDDPTLKEKKSVDIILLIIFFLSLGLLIWSISYAYSGVRKSIKEVEADGDIAVVHSKVDFGLTIDSFSLYKTEDKASEYSFYVQNNNDHQLSYKIKIKSIEIKNQIDSSLLNFALYKNKQKVSYGVLENQQNNILAEETTLKNSKDQYLLKIWSQFGENKSYKYKIEVNN